MKDSGCFSLSEGWGAGGGVVSTAGVTFIGTGLGEGVMRDDELGGISVGI